MTTIDRIWRTVTLGASVAILTLYTAACGDGELPPTAAKDAATASEVPTEPRQPEKPATFTPVEGTTPGPETPYDGDIVAYSCWNDAAGTHHVILSRSTPQPTPTEIVEAEGGSGQPGTVTIMARYYRDEGKGLETHPTLVFSRSEAAADAGFYKAGITVRDIDGDGLGDALFAYWLDRSPWPGALGLELVVLTRETALTMSGTTRLDPENGQRTAPTTSLGDGMTGADASLKAEALSLWNDAQFDMAQPSAFPGFYEYMRFDGATLSGDDPPWSAVILPQYALLRLVGSETPTVVRYESLRIEGLDFIIEGTGEVESWNHRFRITLREEPSTGADGRTFPFSADVVWSDGTRLSGHGRLAE